MELIAQIDIDMKEPRRFIIRDDSNLSCIAYDTVIIDTEERKEYRIKTTSSIERAFLHSLDDTQTMWFLTMNGWK